MTAIGGYFDLEPTADGGSNWHNGGLPFSTGRACISAVLRDVNPSRVHVPAYTCDSLFEPMKKLGIEVCLFDIDDALLPATSPDVQPDELLIVINYFGITPGCSTGLSAELGKRLIIDNSQAFYAPPSNESWSLYSARKFFGVADGAYLWGKEKHESFPRRTDRVNTAFLKARSRGDVEEGYQEFRKNEELLDSEILSPTEESEAILAQVDHPLIMGRRLENYALLHEALGAENQLSADLAEGDIPLCYPFLPSRSVDRSILHSKKIFVPTYWQHAVDNRPASFSWERNLSQRMLPLPVDQRYGEEEMHTVIQAVQELL